VLVEAMCSGTPVVAPASGGPAEIVDDASGAVYPPGNAKHGAEALTRALRDRERLSRGARKRAESAFSLEQMQARYEDILGALASRSPRGAAAAPTGTGMALVTVTHNSAPELARLAASAARHLPGARLIVVDNASEDDSRRVAQAAGATLIAFEENRGFGAAANAGVGQVDEPVTALVNPDVELVDDSLARLAQQAQPDRLLAPLLLNADGTRQDSAHPAPASAAMALYALLPGPALPGPLRRAAEPWRSRTPRRVAWATAACLLAQTGTLKRLGPFDESIFLYAEDLDLGMRAAETWFHPDARVIHSRAHSTAKAFGGENYELLARQRRAVVRQRLGTGRTILDDVIELMTFADRALLRRLLGRSAKRETERFRARVKAAVTR
jgi:N-acetylglucosaminyl-diphospho-decaprenol L-rhamnosyltransferase